ncbi:MAG: SURF1 family protein [Woeseiaceae bacterium]
MNEGPARQIRLSDLVPPLAALALIVMFTGLGFWQLDRAEQKRALQESFSNAGDYLDVTGASDPALYQPIVATGRFLNERQFLIDNMIQGGRLGYYIITPFEFAADGPVLLVNRGWVAAAPPGDILPPIAVGAAARTVKGRAGRLPRAAIRPGVAFESGNAWPRVATFPTAAELAQALDREVLPFILLANPEPGTNLVRDWQPPTIGPSRHLGYAFQWFALALTVVVVTIVLYRKKRAGR